MPTITKRFPIICVAGKTPYLRYFNGHIPKANLSWTQKKSKASDAEKIPSAFISFFFAHKAKFQILKFEFVRLSWGRTIDKLAISWENLAQVGLQLNLLSEYGR